MKQTILLATLIVAMLFLLNCSQPSPETATLAVVNARIWTGNPQQPWAEALASIGERIAAVGGNDEIRALTSDATRLLDAQGHMLVPGFIDCHVHFIQGGFNLTSVQLRDARTPQEFVSRIREFAQGLQPGVWIRGGDWDHENWGGELPRSDWIDSVTPDNPVMINRLDGHMVLANSAALRAAQVTRDTPDLEGGTIVRDEDGQPSGIFKDNAMSLIGRAAPAPSNQDVDRALQAAMRHVAAQGV
ncbi:MAG: amidohydrolase family protein, partial [Acidobacteriota bacterium]